MPIGFPAYHEEEVRYPGLSEGELLDAAADAFRHSRWGWRDQGRRAVRASTGLSLFSWGEEVIVKALGDGWVSVRSAYVFPLAWLDWGHNSSNVRRVLREMDDLLEGD